MRLKYNETSINKIRRKDRSKKDLWIKEYLTKAEFCSIATLHGDQPFINQNIFFYDEKNHSIYFHTAKEGRARYNIEQNTKVCLCVGEMGRLLPADVALEFSVEYKSVVVFGSATIIEDEEGAKIALQKLMDKYFGHLKSGKDYREIIPEELKRTSVFKISIGQWSGKMKAVEDDFEGAFYYSKK